MNKNDDQGFCQQHKCLWKTQCHDYPSALILKLGETESIKYKHPEWRCQDYRTKKNVL